MSFYSFLLKMTLLMVALMFMDPAEKTNERPAFLLKTQVLNCVLFADTISLQVTLPLPAEHMVILSLNHKPVSSFVSYFYLKQVKSFAITAL